MSPRNAALGDVFERLDITFNAVYAGKYFHPHTHRYHTH